MAASMPPPDLQGALWAWVQSLPPWQSDLLRRLSTIDELDEESFNDALRMVVASFSVDTEEQAAQPEPMPALVSTGKVAAATSILALRDLTSVGSIEAGQRLDFALEGLTIVFGETGSGKSTYVRVLRKACRASDRSVEILPNVLRTGPGVNAPQAGSATLDVDLNGTHKTLVRGVNDLPEFDLAQVSVFDADCAGIYVDGESEITYTPSALRLFERLVSLQVRLKRQVDDDIAHREAQRVASDGFDANTKAGALVLGLTENVNPEVVKALATMTDRDVARLNELRVQVSAAAANDPLRIAAELDRKWVLRPFG